MNIIEIPLSQGQVALIDEADYALVSQYRWHARKCGKTYYAFSSQRNGGNQKNIRMHRLIAGEVGLEVDHIDGDGLNNTRGNLRSCTHAENMRNQRIRDTNKSGYKGVSRHKKTGLWRARITHNQVERSLGYFKTALEAYGAYCQAAVQAHGDFACVG